MEEELCKSGKMMWAELGEQGARDSPRLPRERVLGEHKGGVGACRSCYAAPLLPALNLWGLLPPCEAGSPVPTGA